MPTFRRSPKRSISKKEDGSFNFSEPISAKPPLKPQEEKKRGIFRSSPKSKNRKNKNQPQSLQTQEIVMSPSQEEGSVLDVGATKMIEQKFVPFQHVKYVEDDDSSDGGGIEAILDADDLSIEEKPSMSRQLQYQNPYPSEDQDLTDDDKSLSSLKIGAMNKAKRREFIKNHLKQEANKNFRKNASSPFETIHQSGSFTKHSILPSRMETAVDTFTTFASPNFIDPWKTKDQFSDSASGIDNFDFPSDPFAEFDQNYATNSPKRSQAIAHNPMVTASPVANRVFGFTPTRKSAKKIEGDIPDALSHPFSQYDANITSAPSDEQGKRSLNVSIPPPPPPEEKDVNLTHDSSEVALASPQFDRRKLRHKVATERSSPYTPSPAKQSSRSNTPLSFGRHSPFARPLKNIHMGSDAVSVDASSIGESIQTAMDAVHINDFMKLSEEERVQAYCDLFQVAAETIKDVEDKQYVINDMNQKVGNLVDRITAMENDKIRLEEKDEQVMRENEELRSIVKNGTGVVDKIRSFGSSNGGNSPNELKMLRTELESKDVIIDALQRSMDEWKKETREAFDISSFDFSEKESYSRVEVEELRIQLMRAQQQSVADAEAKIIELKREHEAILEEKDQKIQNQSELITEQKSMILESRQEIQEQLRIIDELRTDVSQKDADILNLEQKISNLGNIVEDDTVSISQNASVEQKSEGAVARAKRNLELNKSIPAGTVKARVAMAASRAMKHASGVSSSMTKDSSVKRNLATFNGSPIVLPGVQTITQEDHKQVLSELREKNSIIDKLKREMKYEISKLIEERDAYENNLEDAIAAHDEAMKEMEDRETSLLDEIKDLKSQSSVGNGVSSGKITKEDENKFADVEEGYKHEIEGLIAEKKEYKKVISDMKKCHKDEINKLLEEKTKYKRQAEEVEESLKEEISRLSSEKLYFEQHISSLEDQIRELESKKLEDRPLKDNSASGNSAHEVGEATSEAATTPASQEIEEVSRENDRLKENIKSLQDEIETVGGLLEETIMSIKEKDDEIEALRAGTEGKGVLGRLTGGGKQHTITNLSKYTDEEIKQLERICKLHQLTIIRQRNQAKEMMKKLDETSKKLAVYQSGTNPNEDKLANLESRLSEGVENAEANSDVHAEYIVALKEKANQDQSRIEELQNETKVLKDRIETLKEKANVEIVLKSQVDDLSRALEARELELKALDESYSGKSKKKLESMRRSTSSTFSVEDLDDDLSPDDLKEIIAKKDKMIGQLKIKINGLEQVSML